MLFLQVTVTSKLCNCIVYSCNSLYVMLIIGGEIILIKHTSKTFRILQTFKSEYSDIIIIWNNSILPFSPKRALA